jgi:hypothetical protein
MFSVANKAGSKDKKKGNEWRVQPPSFGQIMWIFMALVTLLSIAYVSYEFHLRHIDKSRVYGKWTEIGAPSHATDVFYLKHDGVMAENRYLASSFEFDGRIVSFYSGSTLYEYQLFGDFDERLRRMAGGTYSASFVKEGYEHTIPKVQGPGAARRGAVAEHFQNK